MTRSQYASSTTPPAPTLATGTGTATQSGTKYVWLYNRTRAGVTLFSPSASLAIAPNQALIITIPAAAKTPASDVRHTGVVLSHDNNPVNGAVVATYTGSLPATITLDKDSHFAVGVSVQKVATRDTLPTDRVVGMRRYVEREALILEWTGTSGGWKPFYPQTLNPYLTDTLGIGGCDRPLSAITDTTGIIFPDYDGKGGLSERVDFWITNDSPLPIPSGVRVKVVAAIDEHPFSPVPDNSILKAGLLQLTFLGYANTLTGELDPGNAPETVTYQGNNPMSLVLQKQLPPGWAYVLGVQANFRNFDLNNVAMPGSLIQFAVDFESNYSVYNPVGIILGEASGFLMKDGGRRRIVPNGSGLDLKALSGSGWVRNYSFNSVGEQIVPGLSLNTPEQKVLITNNSECFVAAAVGDTSALRAIVSTVDGVGIPGDSQTIALDPASNLRLTLTHPTQIRANYPDVIAGITAPLNSNRVRVYVQPVAGGEIQYFDALISGAQGETILIGGLVSGTVAALPSVTPDFGLFAAPGTTLAKATQPGVFASTNYRVWVAYLYQNTVTSITHSPNRGCIPEWNRNIMELFTHVEDFNNPHRITPAQLGVPTMDEAIGLILALSD